MDLKIQFQNAYFNHFWKWFKYADARKPKNVLDLENFSEVGSLTAQDKQGTITKLLKSMIIQIKTYSITIQGNT